MDQDWFEQCNSLDAEHQNNEKKLIKKDCLEYGSMSQGNSIVLADSVWNFSGMTGKQNSGKEFVENGCLSTGSGKPFLTFCINHVAISPTTKPIIAHECSATNPAALPKKT